VRPVEIDGRTVLRPVVDREAIKAIPDRKTAVKAVLDQFHCDHGMFVAIGGDNHPANLTMRPIAEHHEKTRKIDQHAIAKVKRLAPAAEAFRHNILAKTVGSDVIAKPKRSKMVSRPMPGTKASGQRKRMNGKVETR
jgi:hypothetical protein